jgi:hypothetical protein
MLFTQLTFSQKPDRVSVTVVRSEPLPDGTRIGPILSREKAYLNYLSDLPKFDKTGAHDVEISVFCRKSQPYPE